MTDFGSFGLDTDEVTTRSVETDFARRFGQYFARRIVSRFIHDMQMVVSALIYFLILYQKRHPEREDCHTLRSEVTRRAPVLCNAELAIKKYITTTNEHLDGSI